MRFDVTDYDMFHITDSVPPLSFDFVPAIAESCVQMEPFSGIAVVDINFHIFGIGFDMDHFRRILRKSR
jgi:hypothetical protein